MRGRAAKPLFGSSANTRDNPVSATDRTCTCDGVLSHGDASGSERGQDRDGETEIPGSRQEGYLAMRRGIVGLNGTRRALPSSGFWP